MGLASDSADSFSDRVVHPAGPGRPSVLPIFSYAVLVWTLCNSLSHQCGDKLVSCIAGLLP